VKDLPTKQFLNSLQYSAIPRYRKDQTRDGCMFHGFLLGLQLAAFSATPFGFRPAPGLFPPRPPVLFDFVGTFSPLS